MALAGCWWWFGSRWSARKTLFFSSGMADVALWLGPYMSINCQNYICTRTQKVHKCRQIKSHQTTHKTHNQDDPQIPSQICVSSKNKNSKGPRERLKTVDPPRGNGWFLCCFSPLGVLICLCCRLIKPHQ